MGKISDNDPGLWLEDFPWPQANGNKYDRGHAVVAGGPWMSTGATKLAAANALRSGAGLVSVACDRASLPLYAVSFQAVMTKLTPTMAAFTKLIGDARVTAVLIGPGAGVTPRTKSFVMAALAQKKPLVLDADGMSVFNGSPQTLFKAIKAPVILTPHAGEFKKLFGKKIDMAASREKQAVQAAKLSGAVVILKGEESVIAAPDGRIVVNRHATPFLATAGSGDALAGMTTGLLAQGMDAFSAACAAVWLHGDAGRRFGPGLTADDLEKLLPVSLRMLSERRR